MIRKIMFKGHFKNILSFLICFLIFTIFPVVFPGNVFASTLHLFPPSGNIAVGGTLSVQVRLNTQGEEVNSVASYLAYPADKLDVTFLTPGSAFGIEAERTFGGGVIKISRGSINPVSGNVTVATIGFKGKVAGGATVYFIAGSAVPRASDSSDSLNLAASSGGTYNVGGIVPASPAPVVTQPTGEDTISPTIFDLKVTEVTRDSATISWKTDERADTQIEYGLEKGMYFWTASNTNLVTDHSLTLKGPLLAPGARLYFRVLSKDHAGNLARSEESEFKMKGFTLIVRVTDQGSNPLKGVEVSLLNTTPQKGITNASGEVTFADVSLGKHLLVVKKNSFEKTAEVLVVESDIPQRFDFKTDFPSSKFFPFNLTDTPTTISVLLVIVGLVILVILKKIRGKKEGIFPTPP